MGKLFRVVSVVGRWQVDGEEKKLAATEKNDDAPLPGPASIFEWTALWKLMRQDSQDFQT